VSPVLAVYKREFAAYFASPLAAVFIVIFLMLAAAFTFYFGGFFEAGQADLQAFFRFHPWLYLLLVPAIAMGLWAEERKSGTLELLLTQPLTLWQAVLGKFFAAWSILALALALSFPLWVTVNWLGEPDNGVILAGYLASLLMAGAFLAIGGCLSAATRSQVLAFILAALVSLLFLLAGFPLALDPLRAWLPQAAIDAAASLSVLTHFQAIQRGVLDLRDVLYFVLMIVAWMVATVLVIEIRKGSVKRVAPWIALPVLALAFASAVWVSGALLRGARADLTEQRQYTLSDGTVRILRGLKSPITLQLYYSERAAAGQPQFRVYAQRVRELLEEMVARSGGRLSLEHVDPDAFSDEEDTATGLGLRAVPLPNSGETLFFGIVGRNADDEESVMPFLEPAKEVFLEYDLAKLVTTLSDRRKPVLAVLGDLNTGPNLDPLTGQPNAGWMVDRQLREFFDLRRLQAAPSSIGDDVDLLLLIHPKSPGPETEYAIDQFVLRGGRLLVFVDPDAEADPRGNALDPLAPNATRASDLPTLFRAWGLGFDPNRVVLDAQNALQVQPDPSAPPQRNLAILGLHATDMNQRDVVTAALETVNLSSAGALTLLPGSTLKLEALLQSSRSAMLADAPRVREAASDPGLLNQGFQPDGVSHVLAGRLTGPLKSAFPERSGPGHRSASAKPVNIIVVADTDILSDRLWVERQDFLGQAVANAFANNADFVYNAADNLVGNEDLIAVRTRPTTSRPFVRVDVVRRAAEAQFESKQERLQAQLEDLEQKLSTLQPTGPNGETPTLGAEQKKQVAAFQQQRANARKELRAVQRGLNADIQSIGDRLKAINILAMPLLVALFGILLAWRRRARRAEALE
jgi:ABC-type uncharacterized transport system involved in gliding motility auxiliary subunit/ABC-type transport system involved in multi-copper enzyme maturation permease subunit